MEIVLKEQKEEKRTEIFILLKEMCNLTNAISPLQYHRHSWQNCNCRKAQPRIQLEWMQTQLRAKRL